jgi:hypothetical protein
MLSDLIARMKANPDRGTPCAQCGTTAKDCQVSYLEDEGKCCALCRLLGGARMHRAD